MKIRYKIKQNWVNVAVLIRKNPVVIMPFIFIAFFEFLMLEVISFSLMRPLSAIVAPIVRKFFGEEFLHYPGSVFVVPQLFHYADMAVYVFISVAMTAVSVSIFKNLRDGVPVKIKVIRKSVLKKYPSLVWFGLFAVVLTVAAKQIDMFVLKKLVNAAGGIIPRDFMVNGYLLLLPLTVFIINVILQTFTLITVPAIVMQNKNFLKALRKSASLGFNNFSTLFGLIFVPFLAYLPVIILKSRATELSVRTFPEFAVVLTAAAIIVSVIVDSFMILCASQFLIDKGRAV